MDHDRLIHKRQGAFLPHWEQPGATYAITFRLTDSLPAAAVERMAEERRALQRELEMTGKFESDDGLYRLRQLQSDQVEKILDESSGECVLKRPECAKVLAATLTHFDGQRYSLVAWCVMPNHVHVVVEPKGVSVSKMLQSWKLHSAREINALLGRKGTLWQPEYYDHLIRNDQDWLHCVEYVLKNPGAAGLKNWSWVFVSDAAKKKLNELGSRGLD